MSVYKLFGNDEAQGMMEYGLILAIVSIFAVSALGSVGNKVTNTFDKVPNAGISSLVNHQHIPIANAEELSNISLDESHTFGTGTVWEDEYVGGLDKKYVLVNDIDLLDKSTGIGWEPLGNDSAKFTGIFNGGGFKISNLTINNQELEYSGLFGFSEGALIENVILEKANVSGGIRQVGSLIGRANNTVIRNVHSEAEITEGSWMVGGLIGHLYNSSITRSSFTGDLVGGLALGGLAGYMDNSMIDASYSSANINSNREEVGGIAGWAIHKSVIRDSYSNGYIFATGIFPDRIPRIGGITGYTIDGTSIINSYSISQVNGKGDLFGLNADGSLVLENVFWNNEIFNDSEDRNNNAYGRSTAEMKSKLTYVGWDFGSIWEINDKQYPSLQP